MKPEYVPLNKLNAQSGPHNVRVRVIEKCRPRTSSNNNKFQNFTISNDLGNKMRATLFNEDIEAYADIIKVNGLYEISNPTIKPLPERFQTYANEHQMTINGSTSIHMVEQPILKDGPHYHSIASIPKTRGPEDRIDILGIVLFLEPVRIVTGIHGRQVDVREIVITDSSSPRTMTISLWNDLAHRGTTTLEKWEQQEAIIGFVCLRPTAYKGFSLASTMSTEFITNPSGERVMFLEKWKTDNKNILADRRQRVKEARKSETDKKLTTVAEVKARKADNVMQEEKPWIRVKIPLADYFDLRPYAACGSCSKQIKASPGTEIDCLNCGKTGNKTVARASFTFEAEDDTGVMKLTVFGQPLEQLLKTTCSDIYDFHRKEEVAKLHEITKAIEDNEFLAQLTPANSLSKNGVLKWIIKAVEMLPQSKTIDNKPLPITTSSKCINISNEKDIKNTRSTVIVPAESKGLLTSASEESSPEAFADVNKKVTSKKSTAAGTSKGLKGKGPA